MAGHNKWSKIKRLKGALDIKRGTLFSKLSKEITVATKMGGGDPALNHRLRAAIDSARAQSMPGDNIERAIKKATGELATAIVEETTYEGYAPGGVALLIEVATDNRNRTAASLRSIFTKNNGSFANSGSVAYLFHRKGHIHIPQNSRKGSPATGNSQSPRPLPEIEEKILDVILTAGADDLERDEDGFLVVTPPEKLYAVATALRGGGFEPASQKLVYIADTLAAVTDAETARAVMRLTDAIEENEDVLAVHANCDIAEDLVF